MTYLPSFILQVASNLSGEDKGKANKAIDETIEWLDNNQLGEVQRHLSPQKNSPFQTAHPQKGVGGRELLHQLLLVEMLPMPHDRQKDKYTSVFSYSSRVQEAFR